MKRLKFIAILLAFLPIIAFSADLYRPTGYEAITVDDTAGGKALTVAKYWTASTSKVVSDFVVITVTGAVINYTVDGTTVTSSVGTPALPYQEIVLSSFEEIKNFRAIRTGDTSASIKVKYYKFAGSRSL